ncbi:hypothetical protein ATANTOWER_018034 [Ataeniobius toweri]|uniref:Uncharacterized protein n=1 Tax=Ataeniobius toweri TaxID=208326 RepID=A0ABU7AR71_9TELE|nr:hypothetical protein [Ataeniobius toweri]
MCTQTHTAAHAQRQLPVHMGTNSVHVQNKGCRDSSVIFSFCSVDYWCCTAGCSASVMRSDVLQVLDVSSFQRSRIKWLNYFLNMWLVLQSPATKPFICFRATSKACRTLSIKDTLVFQRFLL